MKTILEINPGCLVELKDNNFDILIRKDKKVAGSKPKPIKIAVRDSIAHYAGERIGLVKMGNSKHRTNPIYIVELDDNKVDTILEIIRTQSSIVSSCTFPVGKQVYHLTGASINDIKIKTVDKKEELFSSQKKKELFSNLKKEMKEIIQGDKFDISDGAIKTTSKIIDLVLADSSLSNKAKHAALESIKATIAEDKILNTNTELSAKIQGNMLQLSRELATNDYSVDRISINLSSDASFAKAAGAKFEKVGLLAGLFTTLEEAQDLKAELESEIVKQNGKLMCALTADERIKGQVKQIDLCTLKNQLTIKASDVFAVYIVINMPQENINKVGGIGKVFEIVGKSNNFKIEEYKSKVAEKEIKESIEALKVFLPEVGIETKERDSSSRNKEGDCAVVNIIAGIASTQEGAQQLERAINRNIETVRPDKLMTISLADNRIRGRVLKAFCIPDFKNNVLIVANRVELSNEVIKSVSGGLLAIEAILKNFESDSIRMFKKKEYQELIEKNKRDLSRRSKCTLGDKSRYSSR